MHNLFVLQIEVRNVGIIVWVSLLAVCVAIGICLRDVDAELR
ncbi:hypothetical protein GXM_09534 [Nostoc sphaeroides CCNUC1]|uniref:Uncharacterized protein n=1 Tax=Nostoc sphaeroides CCNUC1 TaxID=2653204 RepID=A0A5P8WHT7_9NOSO|nr:hypothetical protein GXM_08883 [Nostoc sphaeroides CCNUC1]QFS52040.1 hypothetical protein GXM_09534 [Nostoc sphaeroides CCNUC1]